jgi:hypothetical protein
MFLRQPSATDEYTLFLSSSDQADVRMLRKRVKDLVEDVISPELRHSRASARLAVEMWERAAPERNRPGETTNQRFVRMAREASLTMVLILDELRDGTREELEAALDEPEAQLAVLSFSPGRNLDEASSTSSTRYSTRSRTRFSTSDTRDQTPPMPGRASSVC